MFGTPHFVQPCKPTVAKAAPTGEGWLHEPKLDGYRLQVVKDGRQVRLYSRGGHDWTKRLAHMAEALKGIPCRSAVIDGELVLPGKRGTPDFTGLAAALKKRQDELAVYAFDFLHRDGRDLWPLPLIERRRRLERLLSRAEIPCLRLVECFDDGVKLLEAAEDLHLEGEQLVRIEICGSHADAMSVLARDGCSSRDEDRLRPLTCSRARHRRFRSPDRCPDQQFPANTASG